MDKIPLCPKCNERPKARSGRNAKRMYRAYCLECDRERKRKPLEKTDYSLKNSSKGSICQCCKKRKKKKNHTLCDQCHHKKQVNQFGSWNKAIYKIEELNKYMAKDCEFPADLNKDQAKRWEIATTILLHSIQQAREV